MLSMHKPGTDPDNVQMSDVLCDFCGVEWTEDRPMVEGHQGSVICGDCLTAAYRGLVGNGGESERKAAETSGVRCTMCLERRDEPMWRNSTHEASICLRCAKRSSGLLHKDPDWDWRKPEM
jgi:hypothetical protein